MTLSVLTKQQLSTDPPQNKEEAVLMFEIGEECQRRALRYLVEVVEMTYGEIVKFAHEGNPNSRINKDKLKRLAAKMKADGEPLQTKVPQNFLNAPKRPVRKRTETVENFEPEIERVQVVVKEPTSEPTPTPSAPAPEPAPSVPSSEPVQWEDDDCLDGWNGKLNKLGQQIYKREVASSRRRIRMAEQLSGFKSELEKSMRAASNNHRTKAGKLLEADVKMVEATLQREGRPGIKETLEAVLHEAERIQKFASLTLQTLQLMDP
jgi:hypothetical protein